VNKPTTLNKPIGKVFILSGPSGSGKTTLHKALLNDPKLKGKLVKSVSATTREKREGERAGRDYLYLTRKTFESRIKKNYFLEWEKVFDNYYGTPNAQVMVNFVDPKNNFAFEFHQYFDADFSGTKAECATAEGDSKLAEVTAWLKANNFRGFLGEFGGGNNATCQATIGRVLQYLENNKQWIGWTWWAAGPWWGNYFMSIEKPTNGDAPQMSWLSPFLK
jgi:aryl-phospho-beta-D-glucosidase BglC (GH1 family)